MNRMLLAVLLAATPAFAHRHEREYDDDRQDEQSWQENDDRSGAYGDERYDWSLPNDDQGWQSDDSGYASARGPRSEEHTSELQSLTNLVCRLLLEKKKKKTTRD